MNPEKLYCPEYYNKHNKSKKFNNCELNFLLEQQIIIMMNMIPKKDIRDTKNIFKKEKFDMMAPLEILNSNSLCDYMLEKENFIKGNLRNYKEEIKSHF